MVELIPAHAGVILIGSPLEAAIISYPRACGGDPEHNPDHMIEPDDVYIVWMCKTLQNSKALLSTPVPDTRYYEVTYNGDKCELYLDAYVKEKNICFDMN